MADLNVTVGADISAYKSGMAQAGQIASTTSNEITKDLGQAAQASTALGGSVQSASMKFMQMRSGISAARDGLMGFTIGGQAGDRMLMAMGHHINSLVNETGSFTGAMKAMGSSLAGVGGIILGLTAAFELYKHFSKESEKEAKDSASAQKEYVDTLNSVRKATLQGKEDGFNEITRLKLLYDATQNHTLSLKTRNQAYDELMAKYPKYFDNASREKTLLGENSIAYDKLAASILAAANAKAYENQIGVNSNRAFENEQKVLDELKKQTDLRKQISSLRNERELSTSGREGTGGGQTIEEAGLVDKLGESLKKVHDLKEDTKILNQQNGELAKLALNNEIQAGFKTENEIDAKNKKLKEQKDAYQLLQEQVKKTYSALASSMLSDYINNQGKESQNTINLTNQYERLLQKLNQVNEARKNALIEYGKQENIRQYGSVFPTAKPQATTGISGSDKTSLDASQLEVDKQAAKEAVGAVVSANAEILSGVQAQYDKGLIDIKTYLAQKYFLEESNLSQERSLYKEGTVEYANYTNRMTNLTKQYDAAVKKANEPTREQIAIIKELSHVVGQGLMNAFQQALSGTKSFVQAMGEFLLQLIEKLVAAAAAAAVLAVLLSATGFGAVANFGQLFGQLSGLGSIVGGAATGGGGGNVQGFATGGIFTQPRIGMFAEAGPEAIVTPEHLADFAGVTQNQQQPQTLSMKLQGSNMLLFLNRANKTKSRTS